MENTIKIVKKIEQTHKNLGLPVVFSKLVDLANMGLFISGTRGVGKGAVLHCAKLLRHRDVIVITRVTPAGLVRQAQEWSNKQLTIINPDFSSFYTDYLKDAGINLISYILTEHGVPKSWTAKYSYEITNCTISFLSSTQPRMLRKINTIPQWESMYRDRFLRLHMLYPLGTPKYREDYPEVPEITVPNSSPDQVTLPKSIKEMPEYKKLKEVIFRQTSEGRAEQYTDRLLRAHAYLNNRDTVAEKDVKFLYLFIPYLAVDYLIADRDSVASPLRFNPDAYLAFFYIVEHREATRKELKEYFLLKKEKGSISALTRALDPLKAANLIEGVYGSPTVKISRRFKEWIDKIEEWYESI